MFMRLWGSVLKKYGNIPNGYPARVRFYTHISVRAPWTPSKQASPLFPPQWLDDSKPVTDGDWAQGVLVEM